MQVCQGLPVFGNRARFPGVTHCATPARYRRWPGSVQWRQRVPIRLPPQRPPTLIDFAMRQIPARTSGRPGIRGDQLRVAVASWLVLRRQADHPAYARPDRRRPGDRQQLPVRQARRDGAIGLRAGSPVASPTRTAWVCTAPGGGRVRPSFQCRRRHQPRHLEQRGAAVVSRNQLRARRAAHRRLRRYQAILPMGRRRRVIGNSRTPGRRWAWRDAVLVSRPDRPCRFSTNA